LPVQVMLLGGDVTALIGDQGSLIVQKCISGLLASPI